METQSRRERRERDNPELPSLLPIASASGTSDDVNHIRYPADGRVFAVS